MAHQTTSAGNMVLADELQQLVPYSRNHIRRLEAAGQFPRRVRLGANRVVNAGAKLGHGAAQKWATLGLLGTRVMGGGQSAALSI